MKNQNAVTIWRKLQGIICVYKQADTSVRHVRHALLTKLCADLNKLECRPNIPFVNIEGSDITQPLNVTVKPSLADDVRVVGPRYQIEDVVMSWSNYLSRRTSGILQMLWRKVVEYDLCLIVLGIRSGTISAKRMRESQPCRTYRIKGVFGQATDTYFSDGKVVERSTHWHVKLSHLERFLSAMQASHQRKMFELCGLNIQSQAAYELAAQGLIRPSDRKIPVIYGIRCVHFENPHFTIEVLCVNEYEKYLMALIHEIGQKLHSTAHCTSIQCIRHGKFVLDHALLPKHWTIPNVLRNIENSNELINNNEHVVNQTSAILSQ